jgi:hypothetical protein
MFQSDPQKLDFAQNNCPFTNTLAYFDLVSMLTKCFTSRGSSLPRFLVNPAAPIGQAVQRIQRKNASG